MGNDLYDPNKIRAEMDKHGAAFEHKKNAYQCPDCHAYIVTIDREKGVTPFMVQCGSCEGMATSKMYRVSEALEPTHEWYRPETADGLSSYVLDHVMRGGLLLRKIGGGSKLEGWMPEQSLHDSSGSDSYEQRTDRMLRELERQRQEILDACKFSMIRKRKALCTLKRQDYPSRQAYRYAKSRLGKSLP